MRREAILIQRINWPRMIDSTIAPLGFDCCAPGACRRLLQHNPSLSRRLLELFGTSADDPGCVKTLAAVVSAQQENRTGAVGESFMRQRYFSRINLASE
jgi:hypothetical protein